MKHNIYTFLLILLCYSAKGQSTSLRGLYIDHFSNILGDANKEDSLLNYAQDSSFNYLLMYDLQSINLSNTSKADQLGAFIKRARENYGLQYVGAVGENYNSFKDKIAPFNLSRTDDHERFNVFNLEFEFWTQSSVTTGGYYCTQYLQQANCNCDTSGGFKFFIKQMHQIDSLAATQQVISETYLGWFNQGQASQIQQNVDRVLLHAYRTGTSSLFSYSKTRMSYLASNNSPIDIAPIFSAEPDFMGPWLESHSQEEAYNKYKLDYDNDNSNWKQYVNILGYQWFVWRYMPRPDAGSFSPVVTFSGSNALCAGGSVTLTASSGDSYHWNTGQTTRSIDVSTGGNYSCDVTIGSVTETTPSSIVTVRNKPTVSISEGIQNGAQLPLTANATAGSGTVYSYQWQFANSNIDGATNSELLCVADGNYSVIVTNSYGCSTVSSQHTVTMPGGNCFTSVPGGLSSTALSDYTQLLKWDNGQTGDSIIIKLTPDNGSSSSSFIRMKNVGQSEIQVPGLLPQTTYEWQIYTVCGSNNGTLSSVNYFTTGGISAVNEMNVDGSLNLKVYPNPSHDKVQVDYESNIINTGEISLTDIRGSLVYSKKVQLNKGSNKIILNVSEYKNGIYVLTLKNNSSVLVKKIIIE
jgi:hypothetical protein